MKHRPQRLHSLLLSLGSEILGKIKDPAVNNGLGNEIISFTDVKVSKDLRNANFFVSIMATPERQKEILEGLKHSAGYFHRELRQAMSTSNIPNVSFILDNTMEKAAHLISLINKVNKDLPALTTDEETAEDAPEQQDEQ
ncbi:MAG: 30S ribosome-binding factor RbfA [bacterium]|nr:30S ribosome-binding factor RbfA [bacterium]